MYIHVVHACSVVECSGVTSSRGMSRIIICVVSFICISATFSPTAVPLSFSRYTLPLGDRMLPIQHILSWLLFLCDFVLVCFVVFKVLPLPPWIALCALYEVYNLQLKILTFIHTKCLIGGWTENTS